MNSAEQTSGLERCPRIPYWAKKWKPRKMKPVEMLEAGVRVGLLEHTRSDFGVMAGEEVYGFGSDPGIDSQQYNQHAEVVHLACIADVVTSAIRKKGSDPWKLAPPLSNWESGCYLSPDAKHLRRIVFVTSWSDDRHYSICRSWETLGEVVHHGLPMKLVAVVLGNHREGRYHSFWSHALRHPSGNKVLRFRKKNKLAEPFKESWNEIWREDYDDISTEHWLQCMLDDGVLQDCLLRIDIPVPRADQCERIIDLAQRKLNLVREATALPDQNLSTCDWPVPCVFRTPCHALEEPGPTYGFIQIT